MPFSLERTKQIEAEIQDLLASNRLNDWERSFLRNMEQRFAKTGARTRLSNAQYKKLHQLLKLGPETPSKSTVARPYKAGSQSPSSRGTGPAGGGAKQPSSKRANNTRRPKSPLHAINAPRRVIRQAERKLFWPIVLVLGFMGLLGSAFDTTPTTSTATPRAVSTQVVQTDSATYLYVTGDRVNQREGPGTANRVMGQLAKGAACDRSLHKGDGHRLSLRWAMAGWRQAFCHRAARL